MEKCQHCGLSHEAICPRIKAIEYHDDGVTIRRVEYYTPSDSLPLLAPMHPAERPPWWPPYTIT